MCNSLAHIGFSLELAKELRALVWIRKFAVWSLCFEMQPVGNIFFFTRAMPILTMLSAMCSVWQMVRQCHIVARLADRWRITIHTMPPIVLSVQLALTQLRTTRRQATLLQWAMITCTVLHRSVKFSRRTTCSSTVHWMQVMTLPIRTAQTLARSSNLQMSRMWTTARKKRLPRARMWTTTTLMSMMPTAISYMSTQAGQRRTALLMRKPQSASWSGTRRTDSLLLMIMVLWLIIGMMQMESARWRHRVRVIKFMWTLNLQAVARTQQSSHCMCLLIS